MKRGYRARLKSVKDFHVFIESFRRKALKAYMARYAKLVAAESVLLLDCHRLGIDEREADDAPVAIATARIRAELEAASPRSGDPVCEALVAPYDDGYVYFWFLWTSPPAAEIWTRLRGVQEFDPVDKPADSPERRIWTRLLGKAGTPACHLHFRILSGQGLPTLSLDTVVRHAPEFAERVRACGVVLRERLGAEAPADADEAVRRVLPRGVDKDGLSRFGRSARLLTVQEEDRCDEVAYIDHADLIELEDGRLVVAVFAAGLKPGERVFLQVGESFFAVIQGGVQFGHVEDVSEEGLEMLRAVRSVQLIEIAKGQAGDRVVGRHVAVVNDLSPGRSLASAMGLWRGRASQSGRSKLEELKEWL